MRYYNLTISGQKPQELNENNPWGLDLNFQIQGTTNAAQLIPTTIEIINGPLDLFVKDADALKGSRITLKAGVKNCPFMKNQGVKTNSFDMALAVGVVGANFSQWELTDTRSTFQLNCVPRKDVSMSFQLEPGAPVASITAAFLNQMFYSENSGVIFTVDLGALRVFSQNQTSISYQYKGQNPDLHSIVADIHKWLSAFHLGIAFDGNAMTIYHIGDPTLTPSSMVNIHPSMLLTQPVYAGVKQVQLEIALNPNITLGSLITIGAGLNLFSGTLLGDVAGVILRQAQDSRLLQQGTYRVSEVIHRGESRNPDPRAWSTTIKAVKVGV